MNRLAPRVRAFAGVASCVAGFVDAVGFLALGGFFVSFMSGNTTRMGVGLADRAHDGLVAIGLIGTFVLGVILGSTISRIAGRHRRTWVLLVVATLLAAAIALHTVGGRTLAFTAMALVMGAENAVFERDGDVQIGLTYMTGTLVKLGQRLAGAVAGGERWAWLPYLAQWLSLATGALSGALLYPYVGISALWLPVIVLLALSAAARRLDHP
ncbi:DUF1275 domain-containing protein [Sphingomonas sp. PAMC26645]|nr:DUF1275 domain-containing protein [Sphingomonas sp. PAMC26645]